MTYGDGRAWRAGPHVVYRAFAAAALDAVKPPLAGMTAVDAGAGTGAMAEELTRRGARAVCADLELAMVAQAPPPRLVCDITALALRDRCVDLAAANFVLSHVPDPEPALTELARVTRPGGLVLATGFPTGDTHPVKEAVDAVLVASGYRPPEWYQRLKQTGEARVGDPAALTALAEQAGLQAVRVARLAVSLAGVDPATVVAWRLGMAQVALFLAALPTAGRAALTEQAHAAVTGVALSQPVRVLVVTGVVG